MNLVNRIEPLRSQSQCHALWEGFLKGQVPLLSALTAPGLPSYCSDFPVLE